MKIRYREKLVGFIDVLGFSNLVYNKNTEVIENYFGYLTEELRELTESKLLTVQFISDSIVISTNLSKENLTVLINILAKIQYFLLLKGILIRGSISFGNLYSNKGKNIIVGPGLINAYNLEGRASVPRIIIDRRLIVKFAENTSDFIDQFTATNMSVSDGEDFIKFDPKEGNMYPYINYLRYTTRLSRTYLKGRTEIITKTITDHYYTDTHYQKYHWLLTELKIELSKTIELYSSLELKNSSSRRRLRKMELWKEEIDKI